MGRVRRISYLSHMWAAKVQASLRIRAVSPEPSLLAHTSSESRGTVRQKARSLAPLNSWACAVKICHDGMLEDTNSLDGAQMSCTTVYQRVTAYEWCFVPCFMSCTTIVKLTPNKVKIEVPVKNVCQKLRIEKALIQMIKVICDRNFIKF